MNWWKTNDRYVREFLAETLGTFALVLFGDGAVAQVTIELSELFQDDNIIQLKVDELTLFGYSSFGFEMI